MICCCGHLLNLKKLKSIFYLFILILGSCNHSNKPESIADTYAKVNAIDIKYCCSDVMALAANQSEIYLEVQSNAIADSIKHLYFLPSNCAYVKMFYRNPDIDTCYFTREENTSDSMLRFKMASKVFGFSFEEIAKNYKCIFKNEIPLWLQYHNGKTIRVSLPLDLKPKFYMDNILVKDTVLLKKEFVEVDLTAATNNVILIIIVPGLGLL